MSTSSTADLSDLDSAFFNQVAPVETAAEDSEATTPTHPLYSSKLPRGRHISAKDVWAHARKPLPHETERNEHGHKVWYCKRCSGYQSTVSNGRIHLRTRHGIDLRKPTLLQQAATQSSAISSAFTTYQKLTQAQTDLKAINILKSAVNKVGFRNALARLITRLKLKHTIVEYEEFKALCLSLNW